MEVSNRIVMPAMHIGLGQDGYVTKKFIDFYVERSIGGTGLITIGGCSVSKYGSGFPTMISIDDDKYIPKLKETTDAIHKARDGVKISAQLIHFGGIARLPPEITPIAPSAIYSKVRKSTPKEMTIEDIKQEQQAFAEATVRAKKAGFDAVEIAGSNGFLLAQFESPKTNHRTDKYGGDLDNRLRFPLETLELIRSRADDFVVGYRIAGNDFLQDGTPYHEKAIIAKTLSKYIDYYDVTGGWGESPVPQITMDVPEGCYSYLAENIKKSVSIPVFSSNRINNPEIAEQVLMSGKADAVCIGRGLIADPYLPMKAENGDIRDIMNCIGCNQGCFDTANRMISVSCLRNARAGNEAETELKPLQKKKKVMIIGSGPAGLEAARVARIRGHDVHLFEKSDKIGGLLNIIWVPPGRNEFKRMIDNYNYWIQKHGINVHLGQEVFVDTVKEFNPDAVIIATGSSPVKPNIPGIERDNVFFANDVFSGDAPVGKNNVIIGGGATGVELAIYLAKYGQMSLEAFDFLTQYKALELDVALGMIHNGRNKVSILEQLPRLGKNIGITTRWVLIRKCRSLGVEFLTSTTVTDIGENYVNYRNAEGNEDVISDVDYVYYATGVVPNDSLFNDIKALGNIPVERIGDARTPESVLEAVAQGFNVANSI